MKNVAAVSCLFLFALLASNAWASSSANGPPFLTDFSTDPLQPVVGQPVTILIAISKATQASTTINVDFGDGTAPASIDATGQKGGQTSHTYATAGGFTVRVSVLHNGFNLQSFHTVVVGRGTVVNPINAAGVSVTDSNGQSRGVRPRFAGGVVNVTSFVASGTATAASVTFEAENGTQQAGSGVQTSFTAPQSGLFRVLSNVSGSSDIGFFFGGDVRKTIGVGAGDVGESGALANPPSFDIVMKKIQGKFVFNDATKLDSVSFSGAVKLPPGFNPARPGGIVISVGIGNVLDTITIDEKGKPTGTSTQARIKKLKIKYPKLDAGAVTVGGEELKIDVTYGVADLDILGFDTEGVTNRPASGEFNLKQLRRDIQVNLLVSGVPYETKAPVVFKLSKRNDDGTSDSGGFKFLTRRAAP